MTPDNERAATAATAEPGTDGRDALPRHTTPTWEMELLVSGATVFGLLQLPRVLDHGYYRVLNLVPDVYARLAMPLWLYAKVAVLTLVLTFIAHLCLRGYWVALVGLDSVYPGGIRPDKLNLGPMAREHLGTRLKNMRVVIERADNLATRVFGVGFGFAMTMLVPIFILLPSLGIALLVGSVLGERHAMAAFWVAAALLAGPWMLATTVDRMIGARRGKSPMLERAVIKTLDAYDFSPFAPSNNPLVALFQSNTGRVHFFATMLAMVAPVTLLVVMQLAATKGELPFGLDVGIAPADPFAQSTSPASFYGDQRSDGWSITPLPHIPSRLVSGSHVPLFIPYVTRRHRSWVDARCPAAAGEPGEPGADASARLACIARLLDIRVDGAPIAVRLDASSDRDTGQPGLLAMLPVGALAQGRHEISLNEPPRRKPGDPIRRYRIAFWK